MTEEGIKIMQEAVASVGAVPIGVQEKSNWKATEGYTYAVENIAGVEVEHHTSTDNKRGFC